VSEVSGVGQESAGGSCGGIPQEYEVVFHIVYKSTYKFPSLRVGEEKPLVWVRASLYRKKDRANPYSMKGPIFDVLSWPIEAENVGSEFKEFAESACKMFKKLLQVREFAEANGLYEEYEGEETVEDRIAAIEDRIAVIEDRVDELESERG
jgi:hypothetical protein